MPIFALTATTVVFLSNIVQKLCGLSLFRLLYLSTSTVQCLEISRVQNLEISRLCMKQALLRDMNSTSYKDNL